MGRSACTRRARLPDLRSTATSSWVNAGAPTSREKRFSDVHPILSNPPTHLGTNVRRALQLVCMPHELCLWRRGVVGRGHRSSSAVGGWGRLQDAKGRGPPADQRLDRLDVATCEGRARAQRRRAPRDDSGLRHRHALRTNHGTSASTQGDTWTAGRDASQLRWRTTASRHSRCAMCSCTRASRASRAAAAAAVLAAALVSSLRIALHQAPAHPPLAPCHLHTRRPGGPPVAWPAQAQHRPRRPPTRRRRRRRSRSRPFLDDGGDGVRRAGGLGRAHERAGESGSPGNGGQARPCRCLGRRV
jgi:hypothetical protein